ncbi:MAG: hypothetical protein AAGK14_05355 [Verrucomicrobiota bacterium]
MDGQNTRPWWQPRTRWPETATVLLCQMLFWGLMLTPIPREPHARDPTVQTVGEFQIEQIQSHPHYLIERAEEVAREANIGNWPGVLQKTVSSVFITVIGLIFIALRFQLFWLWLSRRVRGWCWDLCGWPFFGWFLLDLHGYATGYFHANSLYDWLFAGFSLLVLLSVALGAIAFGHLGRVLFKPRRRP